MEYKNKTTDEMAGGSAGPQTLQEGEQLMPINTPPIDNGRRAESEGSSSSEIDDESDQFDNSSVFSSVVDATDDNDDAVSELGSSADFGPNDSAMGIANILGIGEELPTVPTYPEGEYEDDKANMIAKLMQNHGTFVTSSLVERSNLIQSVTWLSHHVPGCVLKSLFESIMRARKQRAKVERRQQRQQKSYNRGGEEQKRAASVEPLHTSYQPKSSRASSSVPERKPSSPNNNNGWLNNNNGWLTHDASISTEGVSSTEDGRAAKGSLNPPFIRGHALPYTKKHDSAILFCDISGFTKIAVLLDLESLSSAINSYFQMIVNEITSHGGDILKFAGDALFAEWKVSKHETEHTLEHCVTAAANCAAAIVANCSDYAVMSNPIGSSFTGSSRRLSLMKSSSLRDSSSLHSSTTTTRRGSMLSTTKGSKLSKSLLEVPQKRGSMLSTSDSSEVESSNNRLQNNFSRRATVSAAEIRRRRSSIVTTNSEMATLNVKCSVGVGHIVGIHVGDDISRREYLILGDPIRQVARAEAAAQHGEVFASPEAIQYLSRLDNVEGEEWDEAVKGGQPIRIAHRQQRFFEAKRRKAPRRESSASYDSDKLLQSCDGLNNAELEWLKRMISLYVHPVVVNHDNERATPIKRRSDEERHLAEAELRNVYTCFITPLIDYQLTGNEEKDKMLYDLLNDIMNLCTRELDKVQGHLRQFILDDKGLVLICTFGLRGSTFPNMIARRAVPFSLSMHKALEDELGIKSLIGATFGKAYCGVVGGLERHEFAVLGPSVNLAARLMASKGNPGILVDKNVRLLTSQVFFKPLPAVKAKGYDEPVPIFEPRKHVADDEWGHAKRNFIGRENEVKQIMHIAKDMMYQRSITKMCFVSAMSGSGKSTLMVQSTALVRAMAKKLRKRVIITRNISNEGDSRVPFSLFRSIFRDVLSQVQLEDDSSINGSQSSIKSGLSLSRMGSGGGLPRITSGTSVDKTGRRSSCSNTIDKSLRRNSELSNSAEFSIEGQWDELSLHSHSSKSSTMSTDASRFRFICQELNAPPEFIEVVGKRLLGLREKSTNNSATNAKAPNMQKIVDFMADAFVRCTKHAHLVLLALDDVQWMDEMSWMVVQAIFERGQNVLTFCGSRPPSSNPLSVDPKFWSDLHGQYQNEGRYSELSLAPFSEYEVTKMIATTLEYEFDEIDHSFSRSVFATSGGMPYYLRYVLDAIKQNQFTVRLENGLIGMKSDTGSDNKMGSNFGSVDELLLYRLDALDSSVRTVLHLAAVIGTEFSLLDAALAYEEMVGIEDDDDPKRQEAAAQLIRESFNVAINEGIIEQSLAQPESDNDEEEFINEEDDNLCHSMGNIMISLKGRRKSHPLFAENCCLRFTHDSWKTSILNVMLGERIQEMHKHVAISLERELDSEAHNQDDFEKQIRVFKHWKSSGNFAKAATIALDIGGQLMLLGLNTQAILLFDDVLDILKEMTDDELDVEQYGGISESVLDAIDAPELEKLIKVHIAKGKASATSGNPSPETYQNALDILNNTLSANDEAFDRSVSFPIFSGLFTVLKMGGIEQDEECSYEKHLCKLFVEQARLNGDPIHYGRAMAMEAETLARLGNFEQALEVADRIKSIYNIETQHMDICKAYGSDRVAQVYAHSVNWNIALGRTQAALDTCNFIVDELVPKSNPKNVHNTVCLVFSAIIALKENGLALKARDLFQTRVLDAFNEHFGPGGSTYSKTMFIPILTLLTLQGEGDDVKDGKIDEYTAWAMDSENFEQKVTLSYDMAWGNFAITPTAILSEICFSLAKRQEGRDDEKRNRLMQKAINLMEKSAANTDKKLPFANMYELQKLEIMKNFAEESGLALD